MTDAPEAIEAVAAVVAGLTLSPDEESRLRMAYRTLHDAQVEYAEKAEDAKGAKKNMEGAQEALNRIIGTLVNPAPTPLLDMASEPAEPWRSVRLDTLSDPGPTKRCLEALAAHDPPITTVGELSDHMKKVGDVWSQSIEGIGEKGARYVEVCLEAFWATLPEAGKDSVAEVLQAEQVA